MISGNELLEYLENCPENCRRDGKEKPKKEENKGSDKQFESRGIRGGLFSVIRMSQPKRAKVD